MRVEGVFRTESLDLAAFLVTSGHEPHIFRNQHEKRAIFEFSDSDDLLRAIINFESGSALPAKRLLNVRSRLFREASQVVKGGTSS